jgi:FixJ family two-component response regulator
MRRKIVAVVDDDASMRVGLERLLQARGFDTEIFPSAEAFLARAEAVGLGCVAYLRKPFAGQLLADAIAKATD